MTTQGSWKADKVPGLIWNLSQWIKYLSGFPRFPYRRTSARRLEGSQTKSIFRELLPKTKLRIERVRKMAKMSITSRPNMRSFLSKHLLTGIVLID